MHTSLQGSNRVWPGSVGFRGRPNVVNNDTAHFFRPFRPFGVSLFCFSSGPFLLYGSIICVAGLCFILFEKVQQLFIISPSPVKSWQSPIFVHWHQ